jgi:hypothetical protein
MILSQHGIIQSINRGAALLLDDYPGAAAAYSVRKLRSAYTGSAVRVRRSNDNTEQDIGFDGDGNLDESSLTTFVGANDGFVATWYDQSGNAINATQSTAAMQPRIVLSGVIEKTNGKPTLFSNDAMELVMSSTTYETAFIVGRIRTQNLVNYILGTAGKGIFFGGSLVNGLGAFDGTNAGQISGQDLNQHLGYFEMSSGSLFVAKDGASATNTGIFDASMPATHLLSRNAVNIGIGLQGDGQEFILYPDNESSNRSGIESNINSYYAIY